MSELSFAAKANTLLCASVLAFGAVACSSASTKTTPDTQFSYTPSPSVLPPPDFTVSGHSIEIKQATALADLSRLAIKGRAPKTGYSREQFGDGWATKNGCDTRDLILKRDLTSTTFKADGCEVTTGILHDPYTGTTMSFKRGVGTSSLIQIDHVVALGDAWQTGAQQLSAKQREQMANDPLELWAVNGRANEQKQDSDAASWLPSNKSARCDYIAKQILVKEKYNLWVTGAEHDAMQRVLNTCPGQILEVAD